MRQRGEGPPDALSPMQTPARSASSANRKLSSNWTTTSQTMLSNFRKPGLSSQRVEASINLRMPALPALPQTWHNAATAMESPNAPAEIVQAVPLPNTPRKR